MPQSSTPTPRARQVSKKGSPYVKLLGTLSDVVHDINGPLAVISGHAQLLLDIAQSEPLDPEIAGYLRNIEEASQRLAMELGRLSEIRRAGEWSDGSGSGG